MQKHKVALFIGRFQPFHKGHLFSLKKCFEIAEKVIVGVGSSQESETESNPWDYEIRKKMVELVMREPILRGSSSQVVAIPDTPSDREWLDVVRQLVPKFDVVVSNNDWVLSIMQKAGYKTVETGLFNRNELEGIKIRGLMRIGDRRWKERVPKEVEKIIFDSQIFR